MLNIIREEPPSLSPHFFDIIVIDESHRSIYITYREVLDYFKAINLGLTATPTDIIDHNTFKLFNCDDGLPTFAYTYKEAVSNIPPWLCNFQVMKIHTKFQDEGISKRTISLEDQKKLILEGKEVAEINFEGTEIEKKVINKGTNALIVSIRLDKIEKAIDTQNDAISDKEICKLLKQIEELPGNSVVIRESAAALAKIKDDNFWTNLTHKKIEFLRNTIKPLFRTLSQTDFTSMRFQKDLLEASLAKLADEKEKFEVLKDNITEIISELPLSVNIVAREEAIIRLAQTNKFWAKASDGSFDELADKLAGLMKYRDGETQTAGPAQLNLADLIKTKEMVEFGPEHSTLSVSRYREMVEQRILELTMSNPILQKIKAGKEVTEEEAEELAALLHDEHPHITEDLLKNVYKNHKAKFIQFIKHILGLEILESFPETVIKAFDKFIHSHTNFSSRQLDFLYLLREFVL